MIIGIDHGYYAIKTRNCSFPAGITPCGRVVHALRAKGGCGLLADLHRMAEFCARHPETALGTGNAAVYGVKLRTTSRTYLLRCDPRKDETNFCLYAYETPLLEHCVEQLARQRSAPAVTRFREEAR